MAKRKHHDVVVNKTVSLPLSIVQAVADEAEIMGKTFSDAVGTLLRLAILQRREEARWNAEQLRKAEDEPPK